MQDDVTMTVLMTLNAMKKNRKAVEFCRKNNLIELVIRKKKNYINNARALNVIIVTKPEKYWRRT